MKCVRISKDDLYKWIEREDLFRKDPIPIATLLSGDRIYCCDEVDAGKTAFGTIVGVATIAPNGEENSGQPTIVALYIHPNRRHKGYGLKIMTAVVERCVERGFTKVRVDVMSGWAMRIIKSLPDNLQAVLEINYQGDFMDRHS